MPNPEETRHVSDEEKHLKEIAAGEVVFDPVDEGYLTL